MAKGHSVGPNLYFLLTYTLAFSCSQVDRHNLAATAAFQSASAGGMGRLEEWMGARDEAHAKLCDTVRASRDVDRLSNCKTICQNVSNNCVIFVNF